MSNPLMLDIRVDDRGNPVLQNMQSNIRTLDKHTSNMFTTMKKVFASSILIQAMYSLKNSIYNAGKEVMEFNRIFKQVEGITGTTGKALNDLKLKTIDISNTTEHASTAIAQAVLNLTKMGLTTEESLMAIPHIANLATASITDLDIASEVAIQTLKSFELPVIEIGRVVNVMHGAISMTAIGFEDFAEAMKYVAPVAKTMNIGLEETAAMIGILGNVGIKGSLSGTSLKNMFLNIMKPSEKVRNVLEGLNEEGLTFTKILRAMHEQKVPINEFLETFDKRAVTGSLALSRLTAEIKKLEERLGTISVADAANIIRDAWIPQLLILKNVFINTFITMGEILDQTDLGVSIGAITERFIEFQTWMREHPEGIENFAKAVAYLTYQLAQLVTSGFEIIIKNLDGIVRIGKVFILITLFKYFDLLKVAVIGATPAIGTFGVAMSAAMPIISAAALAILALGEAFKYLTNKILEAERAKISATWGTGLTQIETQIKAAKEFLVEYKDVMKGLETPWGNLGGGEQEDIDKLINKFAKLYNFKVEFFKQAAFFGDDFVKALQTKFGNAEDEAQKIKDVLNTIFKPVIVPEKQTGKTDAENYWESYIKYLELIGEGKSEAVARVLAGFSLQTFELLSKSMETIAGLSNPQIQSLGKLTPGFEQEVSKMPVTGNLMKTLAIPTLSVETEDNLKLIAMNTLINTKTEERVEIIDKLIKNYESELKLMDDIAVANKDIAEAKAVLRQAEIDAAWEQFDAYAEAADMFSGMMVSIYDFQLQKFQEKHQVEMSLLDERYNKESSLVQNNFYKKQIIDRQYQKEKEKLAKQQEKIEKEYAKKRKAWAMIEAAINTAVAVTNVFRQYGGNPVAFVLAAVVAAVGIAQIAMIANQKEYFGGGYTGDGDTKEQAGIVHRGEYVIPNKRLTALGGARRVEQIIDENINFKGTKTVAIYIDTFIGQRDYERGLYKRLQMESTKW